MTSFPVKRLYNRGKSPTSVTSNPVAMLLPVMHNDTFCTITIVRKKRGDRLRVRTRSLPVTWLSITSFPVTWFSVTSPPVAPPKYDLNRADILLRAVHRVNTIDSQDLLLRNVSCYCDKICLECEECMNIVQVGSCTAIKQWKCISRTRAKWIYRWFNYERNNICIFLRRWRTWLLSIKGNLRKHYFAGKWISWMGYVFFQGFIGNKEDVFGKKNFEVLKYKLLKWSLWRSWYMTYEYWNSGNNVGILE